MTLQPSKAQAQRFLDLLDLDGSFTFQTFDDDHDRKSGQLIKVLHGTLDTHFDALVRCNQQGAGIFVCINQTNLKGRKGNDVLKVRACFVDLDGAPVDPVLSHQCESAILVESSSDRWHAYYPCSDMPLDAFTAMQHALADAFDGDHACCDLPRVMRLPGFFHQKVKKGERSQPFMTRIESGYDDLTYTHAQLREAFPAQNKTITDQADDSPVVSDHAHQDNLRDALKYIDPEPRGDWIKVGYALKGTDPNLLALFLEWSRGDLTTRKPHSYSNDADVIMSWNSFAPDRIGIAAVFTMAKANGYVEARRYTGLRLGTQIEVATLLCSEIAAETSTALVHSEGAFWAYSSTYWEEINKSALRKRIHKLDGTSYGDKKILRISSSFIDGVVREMAAMTVERQPPCPRATTILAGFQAAEVGVSFNVSG